jgi:hypothetical protein
MTKPITTVKGKKGTYKIWSELVTPKDGAIDVDTTIKYTAINEGTGEIVKTQTIIYPQNIQNSVITEQIEDWKMKAKRDFTE